MAAIDKEIIKIDDYIGPKILSVAASKLFLGSPGKVTYFSTYMNCPQGGCHASTQLSKVEIEFHVLRAVCSYFSRIHRIFDKVLPQHEHITICPDAKNSPKNGLSAHQNGHKPFFGWEFYGDYFIELSRNDLLEYWQNCYR